MSLKQTLEYEKPWAIMRMTKQRYLATQPWKNGGLPRAKFEELLRFIPDDLIAEMKDEAIAEVLVASIFGKEMVSD